MATAEPQDKLRRSVEPYWLQLAPMITVATAHFPRGEKNGPALLPLMRHTHAHAAEAAQASAKHKCRNLPIFGVDINARVAAPQEQEGCPL